MNEKRTKIIKLILADVMMLTIVSGCREKTEAEKAADCYTFGQKWGGTWMYTQYSGCTRER
jgi:hypothetical protein